MEQSGTKQAGKSDVNYLDIYRGSAMLSFCAALLFLVIGGVGGLVIFIVGWLLGALSTAAYKRAEAAGQTRKSK